MDAEALRKLIKEGKDVGVKGEVDLLREEVELLWKVYDTEDREEFDECYDRAAELRRRREMI